MLAVVIVGVAGRSERQIDRACPHPAWWRTAPPLPVKAVAHATMVHRDSICILLVLAACAATCSAVAGAAGEPLGDPSYGEAATLDQGRGVLTVNLRSGRLTLHPVPKSGAARWGHSLPLVKSRDEGVPRTVFARGCVRCLPRVRPTPPGGGG